MGTTTSTLFKGSSAYSSDFANVISRSVAIASLPIQTLTNQKTELTGQSDELAKLDTKFGALQAAIQKIGSALGGAAYQTSVSADDVVDVAVADGAKEGVYSMKVTSIGAYETSMSAANWSVDTDASGKPATFTLVVGNSNYSVTPADNSARAVVDAINASYGNLVQATTVNVAPGDTRISLKSQTLGQTNLDLMGISTSATPTTLQQQEPGGYAMSQTKAAWDATGSPATYTVATGSEQHVIAPASNSAADVAAEINRTLGSQVRASVVDLGTSGNHDYRISLESITAGALTLDIKNAAGTSLQTQQTAATSRTAAAWNGTADAAGTRSTYTLVSGTTKCGFTPADNSAASVAAAINSLFGSQVQASVVDLGTSGSPDYRISLQSKVGTATTLDIQKTPATSFQREQTAGTTASYETNNSGVTNTSTTRSISISDGVTATLVGSSADSSVDITVTRSTSALNTAMSGFADAYNAAVDELSSQRGQAGGALGGNVVITQLSNLLSSISTFNSSGQISGLKNLGLDLGADGHFTYDVFSLMQADISSSASVTSFLGSATGGGFLKKATEAISSIEAPVTGLLKSSKTETQAQIAKLTTTIADRQNKVDQLQIRLQNQMAISDALIASMEQKYSYFSNMFAAQQTADQMYQ